MSLYTLETVLIYLPAHLDMQYSRHSLAWLEAATGGGLDADGDRIPLGTSNRVIVWRMDRSLLDVSNGYTRSVEMYTHLRTS